MILIALQKIIKYHLFVGLLSNLATAVLCKYFGTTIIPIQNSSKYIYFFPQSNRKHHFITHKLGDKNLNIPFPPKGYHCSPLTGQLGVIFRSWTPPPWPCSHFQPSPIWSPMRNALLSRLISTGKKKFCFGICCYHDTNGKKRNDSFQSCISFRGFFLP